MGKLFQSTDQILKLSWNNLIFFQIFLIALNPISTFYVIRDTIEPGIIVQYSIFLNRELPNKDVVGINGEINIHYKKKINSTHISGALEAIIDLTWIEGRQIINFTQNLNDRILEIEHSEGNIIEEVMKYFGNEDYYYNPIYLDISSLGNSTAMIWGYKADYKENQQLLWNYHKISAYKYTIKELDKGLYLNASYHQDTGLLIVSTVDFNQVLSEKITIHNFLRIFLRSTNIKIEGEHDYSNLILFFCFTIMVIITPLIVSIWLFLLKRKNP